jgi:hypothetical protein
MAGFETNKAKQQLGQAVAHHLHQKRGSGKDMCRALRLSEAIEACGHAGIQRHAKKNLLPDPGPPLRSLGLPEVGEGITGVGAGQWWERGATGET